MKQRTFLLLVGLVAASLSSGGGRAGAAAPETKAPGNLEAWLPEDVIGYAKLNALGERLETFLRSDLRRELESMAVVRYLLSQEPWQKFQDHLSQFRADSGKDPVKVFRDLLGREVVIAARPGVGGPQVVLLTRAENAAALESGLQAIREVIGRRVGALPQPQTSSYKEYSIESYGDQVSTVKLGSIFALSHGQALLEKVIDLAAGDSKSSVEASPLFKRSRPSGKELVTLSVRPRLVPNFHLPEKLDNALGSLLLSGLLGALEKTDLFSAALTIAEGNLSLELSSALVEGGLADKYRGFFPDSAADSLRSRLEKRGILGMVELRRNLSQWWERREDLLVSQAAGSLVGFEQVMSVIFQGRNFQDEVLPEFGPTITLVVRNQEYADLPKKPQPAIPGFAGVFELKSAQKFGDSITAGFQTFIGIMNADQAQKKKEGAMGMLLKTEKVGEVEVQTVSLRLPKDSAPGMPYNFTPSLAVVGSRVVISSSRELAKVLVEELTGTAGKAAPGAKPSDSLLVDGAAVESILELNRDLLVNDSMMKKGSSKEAAEGEIGALLDALKRVRDLNVETVKDGDTVKLRLVLRSRLAGKGPPAAETGPSKKAASL